ncbi:unnamed protein product [Ranitomeya imitator]|uniref:Uncharacterized protein n=1 Tax=Ranitomeya imitator TaxID=111125 RepID=A0ABN9M265_9NEOB|nr:unnamed protein product [Ranitomeya imitator]
MKETLMSQKYRSCDLLMLQFEFSKLLEDPSINKKALMSLSDNNALRAVSIVESTEELQKGPAKTMAAAADAMGSIAINATHLTMSVTDPTAWATAMNNLGMVPVGLAGQQLVSGYIGGLSAALQNAVDKPLMLVAAAYRAKMRWQIPFKSKVKFEEYQI